MAAFCRTVTYNGGDANRSTAQRRVKLRGTPLAHAWGVKWANYFLAFLIFSGPTYAVETEIVPCVVRRMADEKPVCCLKRNDKEFVLYTGAAEVKRYTHALGANMIDALPVHDNALKTALETLLLLRQTGVCE